MRSGDMVHIEWEGVVNRHTMKLDTGATIIICGKQTIVVSIPIKGADDIIMALPHDAVRIEDWRTT